MTNNMNALTRRVWSSVLLLALSRPIAAQTLPDQIRPQVESARLGSGYAQMINLSATPDLSAASYKIDGDGVNPTLDVLRLPYQQRWFALSPKADLYWKVAGGYLKYKQSFPVETSLNSGGSVGSKWSAYSVDGGLLAKISLGHGFTLEPALDLGVARLDNQASYAGDTTALQPFLDGLVFTIGTPTPGS